MILLAGVSLLIWIYLLVGRGGFWQARERDDVDETQQMLETWPSVVAIVPARDEADVIARSIGSLLAQDYPGYFRIILVDDRSSDGTAETARRAAHGAGKDRFEILSGQERPAGWTGKVWAMRHGVIRAQETFPPDYFLFTDADIAHTPDNLRKLVLRAERGRLVLVSLMAETADTCLRLLLRNVVSFFLV
jgi:glycosyltransferase involved in cell wall biosynthesis